MPGEMVLLPLGVAVARLLLHANAGSDAATLLGDAKDGWTALKKLRNRPRGVDAVGEAIAARLEPRLRPVQTREARQDLEAAAHDAVDLFSALAGDPGAVRSAAERPETFVDFVYDNGGNRRRKRMSSAAGQVFDVLVEAAAEEFTQLAPFSPRFVIGAHREVLHRTDAILTRLDAMSDKLTDIHAGVEELRARSIPAQGAIVLGVIPGRPATNIDRDELNTLRATLAVRGRAAVCAGGRGVGKSQLAAAYARERIDERCPLVVWINAETEESILAALAGLAAEVGRADPEGDQRRSAENALRYLNAYTEAGLVVFDNATDREATSPRLPTTGGCQVVITSTDHAFAQLAVEVPVGEFTDTQATDYLRERTTLTEADCELVADELGNLPLALAAAASVISAKRWTAARYLEELAKADLDKALPRTADYPRTLAAAITLTIETVETDSDAALVLVLLSMLDVAGVSRDLLTRIATTLKPDTDVDEALAALTRASVASWAATGDDVLMHRLVARVARDRAASRGNATRNLATTLRCLQQSIPDDHRHQPDTPEFARHILHGLELALDAVETAGAERDAIAATGHALYEYGYSSGATAEAISASERLRELNERLLGPDHPDTLNTRNNLAVAYRAVGRDGEADGLETNT